MVNSGEVCHGGFQSTSVPPKKAAIFILYVTLFTFIHNKPPALRRAVFMPTSHVDIVQDSLKIE